MHASYILATAGHVDHGKSAIVHALTGVDPDRLPEEKARGITIDLGFAALDLDGVHLGIVDVPGHEDFVKNMVAGIGSVDLALLVVAADDGWMPQTEEHLQILGYQGVTRGVVAVTKIDLVADPEATVAAVRERLRDSSLAEAMIVPTSVVTGRGLEELRAALATVALASPPRSDVGKPRLPIDRVFTLRGVGTVVTGTLTGGTIARGQTVVTRPGATSAKVRSVQSHSLDVQSAGPGSRVALNVPEMSGVERGAVVTLPHLGEAGDTLDVWLERSPRGGGPAVLAHAARVFVHHGTAAVAGRVYLLDREPLAAGATALAQLRLDTPIYAWIGDRLVLRDSSQQHTVAGGRVLDPSAIRRGYNRPDRRAILQSRATATDVVGFVQAELADHGAVLRSKLLVLSPYTPGEVDHAVQQLSRDGLAVTAGTWVVDAKAWAESLVALAAAVEREHCERPEHIGLPLVSLRTVAAWVVEPALVEPIVAALLDGRGFERRGAAVARVTFRPALPAHLAAAGSRVRTGLSAKPFEPPNRKELTPTDTDRAALQFLIDTGEATVVGDELVLLSAAVEGATEKIRKHVAAHGPASASDLRQAIGTTRRVMMPLLELLDRRGVTKRIGDLRSAR